MRSEGARSLEWLGFFLWGRGDDVWVPSTGRDPKCLYPGSNNEIPRVINRTEVGIVKTPVVEIGKRRTTVVEPQLNVPDLRNTAVTAVPQERVPEGEPVRRDHVQIEPSENSASHGWWRERPLLLRRLGLSGT